MLRNVPTLPGSARHADEPAPQTRRLVVTSHNGVCRTGVSPSDISELIQDKENFVWLDLQSPQDSDIQLLREEFHFHPLSIEDATRHHERPKLEAFENYYFMVFYALGYDQAARRLVSRSLGLFIGANYLVSVQT